MKIGITLTSSLEVGNEYIQLTESVANHIALRGDGIVYGGTAYGMMAKLAEAYKASGGTDLTGVMARDLMAVTKGYTAFDALDRSFTEDTMEDRKHRITSESEAFIILPGGYGTFEEIGSIVGGKVNKLYDKPIAIYNYKGFYDQLIDWLNAMQQTGFSRVSLSEFVYVSANLDDIFAHFDSYQPNELRDKFV